VDNLGQIGGKQKPELPTGALGFGLDPVSKLLTSNNRTESTDTVAGFRRDKLLIEQLKGV
jgi:hypothetical protein